MQQHLQILEEHEQGGGGAGDATREASAGSAALVLRLERLLSERQDLVRHLDALAPTDDARQHGTIGSPCRRSNVTAAFLQVAITVGLILTCLTWSHTLHSTAGAQAGCTFELGFADLRAQLGPAVVGDCLSNQQFAANGDALQGTTNGQLVWRKADNWTAFTDGHRTWINGPHGIERRLNSERFSWEPDAAGFPSPAAAPPPAPSRAPGAPVLAWHYPQFSQGTNEDFRNAAAARIDALVISETGMSDLTPFLAAARAHGIHAALGVENGQHASVDALVQRLRDVIAAWGQDPGYLRYQGKPVLVFWNLPGVPLFPGQNAQETWQIIRSRVDPGRATIWIGEGGDPGSTLSYMSTFDGLHLYSIAWAAEPVSALNAWANRLRQHGPGKLWVATVMPGGYYGSGSDPSQWSNRDRASGAYYRRAWEAAISTNPAMVIITSYNETVERTEIHPTSEWGSTYLDITREMAAAWHG